MSAGSFPDSPATRRDSCKVDRAANSGRSEVKMLPLRTLSGKVIVHGAFEAHPFLPFEDCLRRIDLDGDVGRS